MVARHADGDACDHRSSIVHLHPLRWPIFSPGESWRGLEVGRKRKKMLLRLRLDWVGLGARTAAACIRCSGPDSMVHHCAVRRPSPRGFSKLLRSVLALLHQ
ncbi:uncharacterized protein [Zea mays]|uniref:uncharacterized protein LOC112806052 n=1 Tax=Zea mays TaxID=4577 RepID=UPI000220B916|nr:uncharacterized protein LOC112806052 [Zea mays]XP_035817455.1 uncharacterized protein LOC112806052 isoform X1 [Zea mays]XP_035817456.1 uncharacterized protein LOC112806052 isoform X1 [Zea mays]XP_035817457.1 uncharacterized protein LOC112806052 isoform X1 [Zea mays]